MCVKKRERQTERNNVCVWKLKKKNITNAWKHLCHKIWMDSRLFLMLFTSSLLFFVVVVVIESFLSKYTRIDIIWNFSKCFRLFVVSFISLFHNFILVLSPSFRSLSPPPPRSIHIHTFTHAHLSIMPISLTQVSLFFVDQMQQQKHQQNSNSTLSEQGAERRVRERREKKQVAEFRNIAIQWKWSSTNWFLVIVIEFLLYNLQC